MYKVSSELASYILLTLDTSSKSFIEWMKRLDPDSMESKLQRLESELETLLKENDFDDMLQLFHALAVP